ncbi:MAG: PRC-barrel domain-containing protein [Parvibaculaceae bacterium]
MKSLAHEVRGLAVHATDGKLGTVLDVVFDATSWRLHFLEVDTGWLFGRDLLIPIEKLRSLDIPGNTVTLDLTKGAAEKSPLAASARPGEEHFDLLFPYFGLASPWGVDVVAPEAAEPPPPQPKPFRRLLFARDLDGYELEARGERIGTVRDVLIDIDSGRVTSLSADLGGLLAEDMREIKLARVVDVDTHAKMVKVDLKKVEMEAAHRLTADELPYILPYIPPML